MFFSYRTRGGPTDTVEVPIYNDDWNAKQNLAAFVNAYGADVVLEGWLRSLREVIGKEDEDIVDVSDASWKPSFPRRGKKSSVEKIAAHIKGLSPAEQERIKNDPTVRALFDS